MPIQRRALLVALVLLSPVVAHAEKLYPVDEARTRPDFLAFRERLKATVARRDSAALLQVIDPEIRVSFGVENGLQAFKKQWRPTDASSPLWRELGAVLSLGGAFDDQGAFWAPYVYSRWPEALDAFERAAVIREGVTVRSRPSSEAPILARLSYDIVKLGRGEPLVEAHPNGPRTWRAIVTPRGQPGYVQSHLLRGPVNYRARFIKKGGQWRMELLVAGD